jgi:hypothetical protein
LSTVTAATEFLPKSVVEGRKAKRSAFEQIKSLEQGVAATFY